MAAGGMAAAAAAAHANKASGLIVKVVPEEFAKILALAKEPLIVIAEGGIFTKKYEYLMSYKGLAFFTKSTTRLPLPDDAQVVHTRSLWIP
ncbi:MAG: hypothetical protein JO022_21335 [Acidobacteriaceae bacterium]|nr:hypothetical protein [Acidobacteriaceae bacterium]